jgi:hypothetical protein
MSAANWAHLRSNYSCVGSIASDRRAARSILVILQGLGLQDRPMNHPFGGL